jgi:adenosine kinase
MLAAVGKDFAVEDKFSKSINYDAIIKDNELFTACANIVSDKQNNQITTFYPGAMLKANSQSIKSYLDQNLEYVMISPNNKDAMIRQLKECKENNIKCFFDP